MTPDQTIAQLRLAADLLETGHPWERQSNGYIWIKTEVSPLVAISHGDLIRPMLATPPDNRPLHNPQNLTAEQVGIGYRLLLSGETLIEGYQYWYQEGWHEGDMFFGKEVPEYNDLTSCRLPLSVPWPESPKPEPSFQLPPCAPGKPWHRKDGWREGDLPQGWRPLVADEIVQHGDEYKSCGEFYSTMGGLVGVTPYLPKFNFFRTRRPLTFEHAGKTWTWHRPGDPMPCDGERIIEALTWQHGSGIEKGKHWSWSNDQDQSNIIGWRYTSEKTTVPLGPEDVPPGSVFRRYKATRGVFHTPINVQPDGVCFAGYLGKATALRTWPHLKESHEINRSIPLTGKWDANAWEPCHKPAP